MFELITGIFYYQLIGHSLEKTWVKKLVYSSVAAELCASAEMKL